MVLERGRRVPNGSALFFVSCSLALLAPGLVVRAAESRRGEAQPASPTFRGDGGPKAPAVPAFVDAFAGRSAEQVSTMILPQVHLRKPCYDFSFL